MSDFERRWNEATRYPRTATLSESGAVEPFLSTPIVPIAQRDADRREGR